MTDPSASAPEPPAPMRRRIDSIDLLRGLVMVVMVLDHARDYFADVTLDPTDVATTTPALFFTRWVTHFCAPTFMLLAGVSAWLAGSRRTRPALARHLAIRGLWLIVLEQTVARAGMFFCFPPIVLGIVLWAIGWSMIALAGLVFLPRAAIGAIGLAMIAGHNAFDGVEAGPTLGGLFWAILHEQEVRVLPGGVPILILYPLVPWIGVMAVGYALGPVFRDDPGTRRRRLAALGVASVVGFVALRALNVYGDPQPWSVRSSAWRTALSFLDCEKYPPSLLFLLMTLGPALLALAALDRGVGRWADPLRTLGRVPLFFYLLQWPVAHGLAVAYAWLRGVPIGWMFAFPPFRSPEGYGRGLLPVYLAWAAMLAILYPACRAYERWALGPVGIDPGGAPPRA